MDTSQPGFSVHGIFQTRIQEWVAISFSRGSSQPKDRTWVSCIVGRHLTIWVTREVQFTLIHGPNIPCSYAILLLQHRTLFPSLVTSTTGCCFHFGLQERISPDSTKMNLIVTRIESQLLIALGKDHLPLGCLSSLRDKTNETIEESWAEGPEKENNCKGF